MTTLKEYKAMMEGATDAPWIQYANGNQVYGGVSETLISYAYGLGGLSSKNSAFIAASRNIAPDLIRVIELAEEALLEIEHSDECAQIVATRALSEIRKLKGE